MEAISKAAGKVRQERMNIKCDRCNKQLDNSLGALVISPPVLYKGVPSNEVLKFHLCRFCYSLFVDWFEGECKEWK